MGEGCNEMPIAPLLPRLDRLDMLMKYIERKHNLSRWSFSETDSPFESGCMPVDLALREAHTKGSLLDRVALLEHRLIQLSLEMEASSVSSSSSIVYTCESPSTRQGSSNKQRSYDDFHSFDGRSSNSPNDNEHEVNAQGHCTQVINMEHEVKNSARENHPANTRESSLSRKSKPKRISRGFCRCKRLLGC